MKLVSFCILMALASLYAGLVVSETALYQKWEHAVEEQRSIQLKVTYFQHLGGFIKEVLSRIGLDSQHDPALVQLLKDNQIKVVIKNTNGIGEEVPPPNATAPPKDTPPSTEATKPAEQPAQAPATNTTHP